MSIILTAVTISQCMSGCHVVHLKYTQFLFANEIPIKRGDIHE